MGAGAGSGRRRLLREQVDRLWQNGGDERDPTLGGLELFRRHADQIERSIAADLPIQLMQAEVTSESRHRLEVLAHDQKIVITIRTGTPGGLRSEEKHVLGTEISVQPSGEPSGGLIVAVQSCGWTH